jgi:hypothetical protein
LHPLEQGHSLADLKNYSSLATNEDFVSALKEGLKATQAQLKVLNMAPSSYARNKQWLLQLWTVERADPKHWAYVATEEPIPGEDGDGEVMKDSEIWPLEKETVDGDGANVDSDMSVVDIDVDMSIVDASLDDSEENLRLVEEECRDAISQMLNSAEPSPPMPPTRQNLVQKIEPVVEYKGRAIYKSTLVGESNGNPFLSKDRLTRIKNSIYFNNA